MQSIVRKTQLRTKLSQNESVAISRASVGQRFRRARGSCRHLPHQRAPNLGSESCIASCQVTILLFHRWNAPRLRPRCHYLCSLEGNRCLAPLVAQTKGIHISKLPIVAIVLKSQVDFINSHVGVAFSIPIVMLDASDVLNANQIARVIGTFGKLSLSFVLSEWLLTVSSRHKCCCMVFRIWIRIRHSLCVGQRYAVAACASSGRQSRFAQAIRCILHDREHFE